MKPANFWHKIKSSIHKTNSTLYKEKMQSPNDNVGVDIPWIDVYKHTFRVIDLINLGTVVENGKVTKSTNMFTPYGYIVVESPIFDGKINLPIIHRDDYLTIYSIFEARYIYEMLSLIDILVSYVPKVVTSGGKSGSPHHVLHYCAYRKSDRKLELYYSVDKHIEHPDPSCIHPTLDYGWIKIENLKEVLESLSL